MRCGRLCKYVGLCFAMVKALLLIDEGFNLQAVKFLFYRVYLFVACRYLPCDIRYLRLKSIRTKYFGFLLLQSFNIAMNLCAEFSQLVSDSFASR